MPKDTWIRKDTVTGIKGGKGKENVAVKQPDQTPFHAISVMEGCGGHLLLEIWSQSFLYTLELRRGLITCDL